MAQSDLAPSVPEHLQPHAERIGAAISRTLDDVQAIGAELANARDACKHGEWLPFLAALHIPRQTAHRWIAAAQRLDEMPAGERARFTSVRAVLADCALPPAPEPAKLEPEPQMSHVGHLPAGDPPSSPAAPAAPEPEPPPPPAVVNPPAGGDKGKRTDAWKNQTEQIASGATATRKAARKARKAADQPPADQAAMEAAEAAEADDVIGFIGVDTILKAAKDAGRALSPKQAKALRATSSTIVKLVKANAEVASINADLQAREHQLAGEVEELRDRVALVGDPDVAKRIEALQEELRVTKRQRDEYQAQAESSRKRAEWLKNDLDTAKKALGAAGKK